MQEFLYRSISRRRDELMAGGMYGMRDWPAEYSEGPADKLVPVVPSPKDILVLVAGGTGKHSCALPSFGPTVSVTRLIAGM